MSPRAPGVSGEDGSAVVRVDDIEPIDEPENGASVRPLIHAGEAGSSLSLTWVSIDGRHRRLRTSRSVRIYYVLSGQILFEIGDEPPVRVSADESVLIDRDRPYCLRGSGRYLVMNTPAFEPGDDEYLE